MTASQGQAKEVIREAIVSQIEEATDQARNVVNDDSRQYWSRVLRALAAALAVIDG